MIISTTQLQVKTDCAVSGWNDYLNPWLFLPKKHRLSELQVKQPKNFVANCFMVIALLIREF